MAGGACNSGIDRDRLCPGRVAVDGERRLHSPDVARERSGRVGVANPSRASVDCALRPHRHNRRRACRASTAKALASPPSRNNVVTPETPKRAQAAVPLAAGRAALPDDDVAFSPAFASVGSAMFYHAEGGDRSAIMRADTDTTGAVLRVTSIVDDDAKNFHARPSPDGERIAFDSDREGERAVYVADANGRNVRRISGEGWAAVPSWSPDGKSLAFVRAEPGTRRAEERPWNLWITDLESGDTRRLTNRKFGQPWGAAWFPDGRRIAYSHEDRLIIRSLDGGDERVFNTPIKGRAGPDAGCFAGRAPGDVPGP